MELSTSEKELTERNSCAAGHFRDCRYHRKAVTNRDSHNWVASSCGCRRCCNSDGRWIRRSYAAEDCRSDRCHWNSWGDRRRNRRSRAGANCKNDFRCQRSGDWNHWNRWPRTGDRCESCCYCVARCLVRDPHAGKRPADRSQSPTGRGRDPWCCLARTSCGCHQLRCRAACAIVACLERVHAGARTCSGCWRCCRPECRRIGRCSGLRFVESSDGWHLSESRQGYCSSG